MFEKYPWSNWELFKARLYSLGVSLESFREDVSQEIRYRFCVPREKHKEASEITAVFIIEAMDFLRENLSDRLRPVRPTRDQLEIFNFC